MEMDSFWVPTFHQAPVGPVDRRKKKKNEEEHWTFSTVLWVSASHPPPTSQELSTKTKIVLFYSNLEAPESRRLPSPAGEPPSPSHPIRPPGPPSNFVSSGNDQQVGKGDPRLQASEKSQIKPLPFLFSPSFLLPVPFPLPSASSSSPHLLISSSPPPPSPTSSCLSPFLRHFCLFPCPLSSTSPLSCLPSPLLHPPLLFSLLLPGSPHILVSSPPPALSPSFSCPDLTLSTLSYPNFPLRRRIPWLPPSATEPQRPHCRLPPRIQRGQLPRSGPWVPQEVAGDRMGWPSWPQPCYLWDRSVPSRPHPPAPTVEGHGQGPAGSGLGGPPPAIPEQVHVE